MRLLCDFFLPKIRLEQPSTLIGSSGSLGEESQVAIVFPTGDRDLEHDPWREDLPDGEVVLLGGLSDELAEVGRSVEDSAEEELGSAP